MGIDDWMSDKEEDEPDAENEEDGQNLEPSNLLRAIDSHIMEASEPLKAEGGLPATKGGVYVRGNTIVADRTRLATVIALAISDMEREELKSLEELTMAEVQKGETDD